MHDQFEIKERQFEKDIVDAMVKQGWQNPDSKAYNRQFDRQLGMTSSVFLDFIKSSQPKEWKRYEKVYGADAEQSLIKRFDMAVHKNDLLKTIREGFKDRGIKFYPMFRHPETSMNQTTVKQYESNIFEVVRQLHYSPSNENSIDIVLFVNGIPIISEELKCQFNGQDSNNAIQQYKFDRAGKEKIFKFKERILAHFAIDLTDIRMTTRLQGEDTYFLPFNQGSNGAGKVGGKGNPINPNGYATDYLWKQVLTPERLIEILFKYLHLQQEFDDKGALKSEKMIFPRYHQLDVVTKLLADVKENGAGKNYLIEHSAGSGKSNSISWLAHRLSGLHDAHDQKIFQSVVIVTDRRVLDQQLQETVYQFDHQPGVVKKIDKDSKQLKDALEAGVPIIITTLQKFPVIYKDVDLKNNRYAVIVDEAHSSQTGNAARKLKYALADTEEILRQMAEEADEEEKAADAKEERMMEELAAQGQQENMSFFAFTATPKEKTLQLFGTRAPDGSYHPFHIYSMRQAIEEGFILDVLQNYMTYKMYYKIAKNIEGDFEMDEKAGVRAVTNFETLHPHNVAQKVSIILDHFDTITSHKIGGRAKAMVVTASRLHAVRYIHEFKRQIKQRGWNDRLDVLVAFSGEVNDNGAAYTEEKINTDSSGHVIKESALPAEFHKDGYQMLVVAEKYQTGFDEPLLHSMFVDKKLSGVKAVQTLSRLNRTCKGKNDTFVLDFVNTAEDIQKAFQPYYEEAYLESEADPNLASDLKEKLMDFQIIHEADYERFADIYYDDTNDEEAKLGRLQSLLQPAIDRYRQVKDKEKRERFKTLLARFNRFYDFITQVNRDFDRDLHKFSIYARFLVKFLPKGTTKKEDVDGKVLLKYYKLEQTFNDSIELTSGDSGGLNPATGSDGKADSENAFLTDIINKVNERFGTEFTEMDKVLEQIKEDVMQDDKWADVAASNTMDTFAKIFEKRLQEAILDRYQQNAEFFDRLFQDPVFLETVENELMQDIYRTYRQRGQAHHGTA